MLRSGIVVGALLLGTSLAVVPVSVAEPGPYVVRSPDAFPRWDLSASQQLGAVVRVPCANPLGTASGPGPAITYRLDDAPPLGLRVWRVDDAAGELGTAVGPAIFDPNADNLTVATVDLKPSSAAAGVATVVLMNPNTFQSWVGFTDLPSAADGWQTVSSGGLVYHWRSYDLATETYGDTDVAHTTYASFTGAQGFSGYARFTFAYGCQVHASFLTDRWITGTPGPPANGSTYDLEGTATRIEITGSKSTLTAGGRLTMTGALMDADSSHPVQGSLELEAMPDGAVEFMPVAQASTGASGEPASTIVRPTVLTSYRWVFSPSDCCEASTSEPFAVEVRTLLTSSLADRTVRKGSTLVLAGKTRPAKPGASVTLWRKTATSSKKLTRARVKADGTYRLTTKATSKGTWKVFATVPAGSGNLAGTSPVRSAQVS